MEAAPPPPIFVSGELEGPIHHPPLFLLDTNAITLLAQVSNCSPSAVDGRIDVEGTSTYNLGNTGGTNLNWKIPSINVSIGLDVKLWEGLSLWSLLRVNNANNTFAVEGTDFGFGIVLSNSDNIKARLDLGLTYLPMDMKYLGAESIDDTFWMPHRTDTEELDPFAALTISTWYDDWIFNPFIQVSYCSQTLLKEVNYSREVYSNIALFTISPGVSHRLNKNILFTAGVTFFIPSGFENSSVSMIFAPFAQFNFLL